MDVNTYIDKIFERAYTDWQNCAKELANGTMFIETANFYKKKLGKEFKSEFSKLMNHEDLNDNEIKIKFKQIDHFEQIQNLRQIVESLKIIKKTDRLTGDFNDLDKIDQSVSFLIFFIMYLLIPFDSILR